MCLPVKFSVGCSRWLWAGDAAEASFSLHTHIYIYIYLFLYILTWMCWTALTMERESKGTDRVALVGILLAGAIGAVLYCAVGPQVISLAPSGEQIERRWTMDHHACREIYHLYIINGNRAEKYISLPINLHVVYTRSRELTGDYQSPYISTYVLQLVCVRRRLPCFPSSSAVQCIVGRLCWLPWSAVQGQTPAPERKPLRYGIIEKPPFAG
jgi:hypothetical protein